MFARSKEAQLGYRLKNPADSEVQGARLNLIGVLWEEWGDDVWTSTRGGGVRDAGMLGGKKPLQVDAAPRLCWAKRSSEVFGLLPAGAAKVIQEGGLLPGGSVLWRESKGY